jgi:thiol-disulfide isomerase/thioredoxin
MTQQRSACRRLAPALPALLAALAALVPAVRAQAVPSDNVLRGFSRISEYMLVVDGREVPAAEIYQSERVPAFLVLSSALPSPVLLSPRTQAVETVNLMKVAKQKDGTVDLLADATLAPQGKFDVVEDTGAVNFTADGHKASLKPKPAILGARRGDELKTLMPEYARGARNYAPNPQAIAALKKESRPVKVRVYFGSWCPHCRQHVPFALRIEDEVKNPKIQFEYFGLPRDLLNDPEVKRMGIKGVPTGVVYLNGAEVGRITGNGWDSPEVTLRSILSGRTAAGR